MPLYKIADHPLLSDPALALEHEVLDAQADVAELVLGLAGTEYTGVMAERAATAVALQVNYQLVVTPDVLAMTVHREGERQEEYRAALPDVYPPSARIVATLNEAGEEAINDAANWDTVQSLRTNL